MCGGGLSYSRACGLEVKVMFPTLQQQLPWEKHYARARVCVGFFEQA